jgi:hypothetical protein
MSLPEAPKIVFRLHLGRDHVQLASWEAARSPRRKETRKQFSPGQGEDYLTHRDPDVSGDLSVAALKRGGCAGTH